MAGAGMSEQVRSGQIKRHGAEEHCNGRHSDGPIEDSRGAGGPAAPRDAVEGSRNVKQRQWRTVAFIINAKSAVSAARRDAGQCLQIPRKQHTHHSIGDG